MSTKNKLINVNINNTIRDGGVINSSSVVKRRKIYWAKDFQQRCLDEIAEALLGCGR